MLSTITEDNADTYFWNGLVATINTAGTATEEQVNAFWEGEGACRMAQETGYSFQNIMTAGTSLCYMKNAPEASSGVTVTSGDLDDTSEIFNQQSANRLVRVDTANDPFGNSSIFIRVYGSDSSEGSVGYAADLWFCDGEGGEISGYENIRVNSTTGTISQTSVGTGMGDFTAVVTGKLTEAADGTLTYDTSETREAEIYFEHDQGSFKGHITIDSDQLISKSYSEFGSGEFSQTDRRYIASHFSGTSLENLRFLEAGFKMVPEANDQEFDTILGGTEFQSSAYFGVDSGTYFSLANSFDLDNDSFFADTEAPTDLLDAIENYDCSATPDVTVTMDMNSAGMQDVQDECEPIFDNMNFCDGDSIQEARQIIFQSMAP